jgi:hypothetical protein
LLWRFVKGVPAMSKIPDMTGVKLWGEVICWTCTGKASHATLVNALRTAGLDESVARELAPRHAFARACKRLASNRIIRQVCEDDTTITFQFTQESRTESKFEYAMETLVFLNKTEGKVTCENPELAAHAQGLLDAAIEARTGSDITRVVQRLFQRQADLFPLRGRGGVYFCPAMFNEFIEKVAVFMKAVNAELQRFPVPMGTAAGDHSVKDAVVAGMAEMLEEHRESVAGFGESTRDDTFMRAAERIRVTRFKLEAYQEYLGSKQKELQVHLDETQRLLDARMAGMFATLDEPDLSDRVVEENPEETDRVEDECIPVAAEVRTSKNPEQVALLAAFDWAD